MEEKQHAHVCDPVRIGRHFDPSFTVVQRCALKGNLKYDDKIA